jgi:hypothetical protein
VLAFLYSIATAGTFFGKSLIAGAVFILPCVTYLGWRKPKPWRKIVASALLFGLALGFFFEFIQEYTQAYTVVSRIFPKLFGVVPIDNILGHFMMALLTFTFYEHFVAQKVNGNISHRFKYAVYLVAAMIATVIGIYYLHPSWLMVPYPYVVFGTLAVLPVFTYAYRHPKSVRDFCLMAPFFFFLYFVIEIAAVHYSWWTYPVHNHIGWVSLPGIRFPFEELFYWMLFYAVALTAYYKSFVDRPAE